MSKTLHWYILRELLRIFILTSSVLTTILAFGGTFRPLTKEGLTLIQLLNVLMDLGPAMLAYSIPLAALFAAVIVYWRLATDNELSGARASGVSYVTLVMPAVILGLAVGLVDMAFVGYVVPRFLQKTSEVVQMDIASMLLHNVDQRQPFQFNNMVVYADKAYLVPNPANDQPPKGVIRTIIQLRGLAAMPLKNNRPTSIIIARAANVIVDKDAALNQVSVGVQLENGTAFDPNSLRQIRGTIRYLPPDGKPHVIGSLIGNKPKFLDLFRLEKFNQRPSLFPPIAENVHQLLHALRIQSIAVKYLHDFKPGVPMRFTRSNGAALVSSPLAMLTGTHGNLLFSAAPGRPVQVQVIHGGHITQIYLAQHAKLLVSRKEAQAALTPTPQQYITPSLTASLELTGGIREKNIGLDRRFHAGPPIVVLSSIVPLQPESGIPAIPPVNKATPAIAQLINTVHDQENRLRRQILSEFQSRASFAFSCIVLVILGTALGIILQGRNPLAVFVVGVVPAMVLVLLINTGREMITRTTTSDVPGTILIWSGNGLLIILNIVIYSRLLKR
jgi:lipopolysaccharide export LptBFGC system permease protein LptF